MPELVKRPRYQVGDKVRLKFAPFWVGTVTEARGSYYEEGHVLYRVHVPLDPEPAFLPLREDEIEKV